MDKNVINKMIDIFAEQRSKLQEYIKLYIKDTSYALDDRWSVYVAACQSNILDYHQWITNLPAFNDVSWYEDFYKERHQTVKWIDVIESIEDSDENVARNIYKQNIDEIKEQILASGEAGFENDW